MPEAKDLHAYEPSNVVPSTGSGLQSLPLIGALGLVLLVSFIISMGTNNIAYLAAWVFIGGSIAMYFVPSFVAATREHPNRASIILLDLLLGWTVLGWVAALVWAYSSTETLVKVQQDGDAVMRSCPFCAEPIRAAAIKCKHCGSALEGAV